VPKHFVPLKKVGVRSRKSADVPTEPHTHVYVQRDGEIARLVIDRPEKRNALCLAMWRAIPPLIDEVDSDPAIKVLIVQGVDDTTFAAGADIDEIEQHAGSEELAWTFMGAVHAAETALGGCGKPVIALIRGDCIGGGIELALACDLRFAQTGSRFGIPAAKLGVVYSLSSTARLVQLVGPGRARDYLFSGRLFDSVEAHASGLIDREIPADAIVERTQAYAETLCRRSQWSIRAAKAIVRAALAGAKDEDTEIRRIRGDSFLGPDLQEGVRAFHERRSANFPWS
jgi:enoyl-CoA hydratase/carnithine racemase